MPTFACGCGHTISLHDAPCPHEASLAWDADVERQQDTTREQWQIALDAHARGTYPEWLQGFYGASVARPGQDATACDPASIPLAEALEDIAMRADVVTRAVIRCPKCGRLHVQREHGTNAYDSYVPETRP